MCWHNPSIASNSLQSVIWLKVLAGTTGIGKADRQGAGPPIRLEASDVRSLQTLGTAGDFEFNRLAFVQRLVPIRLDSGKVDENVLAGLALDESIALAGVEPLHCSLFSH